MDAVDGFALVALVLTAAALAAGIVERAPLSFPMLFLGLGLLLGGPLDLLSLTADSDVLEIMATFTLALVLFLDAVNLEVKEVRGDWLVPALALGPGTLLTVAGVAAAASWLLGLELLPALIVGAVLSSTDPVVLRDVLRDRRIPRPVRRALSVEAGTNDLIVLPIILVLVAIATEEAGSAREWAVFALQLVVLGPAVGAAVGTAGSWLMARADERYGIRREYQALYGVGLVLVAFAAGHGAGGDGFLAAFAAGAAVTLLNFRLCDCFLEFGQVIAEMAMLAAFVLFGATLAGLLPDVRIGAALVLAGVAIVVVRPAAMTLVLRIERAGLSREARRFIAWFGPRGLNSLCSDCWCSTTASPTARNCSGSSASWSSRRWSCTACRPRRSPRPTPAGSRPPPSPRNGSRPPAACSPATSGTCPASPPMPLPMPSPAPSPPTARPPSSTYGRVQATPATGSRCRGPSA